ncbi:REC8 [Auxenochlorella protothecoides x Auxenochlorella symbiontica]|uniref:Sister chromatid cohesion 1 protein 3 n=1 Tax=Auxenochlorella protothecoides TaxID=3075 RepID=A0A1D2A7W4_AUXPR
MFYSQHLLGTKSALGAVWIAAHGKKLNKGKVLQVHVGETCEVLMNPEVPQALRLQAVLAGGVVVIQHRQVTYLLDDCNDALRRLRGLGREETPTSAHQSTGKRLARIEAITLTALDQDAMGLSSALPMEQAVFRKLDYGQPDDDYFLMPAVPTESEHLRSAHSARLEAKVSTLDSPDLGMQGGRRPHGLLLEEESPDACQSQPEMFEVPDVQMPDFPGLDWQEYGGEACVDPTPENAPQVGPAKGMLAQGKQRRVRKRAATVDNPCDIQISVQEYREWMADVGDTLAPRTLFEREQGNPLTVKSLEAPKGLEATFQHALDPSSLPGVVLHGTSWVVTPSPGRKSVPQDEAVMEAGPEQHDLAQEYGRGDGWMPALGDKAPPLGGPEPEYDAELLAGPRSSLLKRVLSSSPGSDIETERLRAALSASPGSAYQTAMLLGQNMYTPASMAKRQRLSGLRPESNGTLISEGSSGTAPGGPVDDAVFAGDLASMLPAVEEEEEGIHTAASSSQGGRWTMANLTQFSLLEESAAGTQKPGWNRSPSDTLNPASAALLGVLENQFHDRQTGVLSFQALSGRLNRREAAKLFAQLLVIHTKQFVRAEQTAPYQDIMIRPGRCLLASG